MKARNPFEPQNARQDRAQQVGSRIVNCQRIWPGTPDLASAVINKKLTAISVRESIETLLDHVPHQQKCNSLRVAFRAGIHHSMKVGSVLAQAWLGIQMDKSIRRANPRI